MGAHDFGDHTVFTKGDNVEIEGPYSFKGTDGMEVPVYIFEPGAIRKDIGKAKITVDGGMTFEIELNEDHKNIAMASFDVPMRFVVHNRPKSE